MTNFRFFFIKKLWIEEIRGVFVGNKTQILRLIRCDLFRIYMLILRDEEDAGLVEEIHREGDEQKGEDV